MAIERIDLEIKPPLRTPDDGRDSEGEEAEYRRGELDLSGRLVHEKPKLGLTDEQGQVLADKIIRRIRKAVNEEIEKTSDCKPLSPSNLSDILQDFLKRGIVHCLYEGKKGKKRVYELTELGKEIFEQLMKNYASKILREFEKAGWVVRIRKPKADYSMTEKGERVML